MNRLSVDETAALAHRIRTRQWGWKQAFNAWYLVHGEAPSYVVDPDGSRSLEREPVEFIKTHLGNLPALGLGDVVQPDGALRLDSAGLYRYQPIGDLEFGFTAYQRI